MKLTLDIPDDDAVSTLDLLAGGLFNFAARLRGATASDCADLVEYAERLERLGGHIYAEKNRIDREQQTKETLERTHRPHRQH